MYRSQPIRFADVMRLSTVSAIPVKEQSLPKCKPHLHYVCIDRCRYDLMKIAGFDWDDGNWPKCGKHGVSRTEIEEVLTGIPAVLADPFPEEARMRAIGTSAAGRYVFVVFLLREINGQTKLRPISARYMHQKEIAHYERQS